jgi:CxxC motif-containing protein (DUF1111 family)
MMALRLRGVVLAACLAGVAGNAAAQHPGDQNAGRELFERVWKTGANHSGPLGPLYNERSCVACHRLGAVGGGGLNSRNVTLVSVEIPDSARLPADRRSMVVPSVADRMADLNRLRSVVSTIHAGLATTEAIVLHAYGVDPRYAAMREQVLGLRPMDLELTIPSTAAAAHKYAGPIRRVEHRGATLIISARNSTAMFGAGLIDRLSLAEIRAAAEDQAERHPEMTGRMLGRFGWRGQTLDLRSFVAGACSVELGLNVDNSTATASPVEATLNLRGKSGGSSPSQSVQAELSQKEFDDLVAFCASLPAPGRRPTSSESETALVRRGEELFESTDCAICHRPSIGNLTGLYSDLLLHDMGPGLYDPQPAPSSVSSSSRPQYYDSGRSTFGDFVGNRPYEWKTAPLWGVADSGPYLHDGRALTLDDAIRAHGGQAESSARRYRELPDADRRALIKFLMSLVAPDADYLRKTISETARLDP